MKADPEFVQGIAEVLAREGWRPRESCLPIAEKVAEHILEAAAKKILGIEPGIAQADPFEPKPLPNDSDIENRFDPFKQSEPMD